jgi:predicted TIM-barrel fold metal-dependent hydrolase
MTIDIHAHIGHHPLMDFKQTPDEIISDMDEYGIEVSFVHPFPSMKPLEVNKEVAEAVNSYSDRFIGFFNLDPSSEDRLEVMEKALDLGLSGLVLDPEFHRVVQNLPNVEELMVKCMENDVPVLFNTPNIETGQGDFLGGIGDPYYKAMDQLAFKFPKVRFVVNIFWPRIRTLLRDHPNVFIDTGGRNGVSEGLLPLIPDIGPTRICFGSESPQNHVAIGIEDVSRIKIKPIYKELILDRNSRRIFKDLL